MYFFKVNKFDSADSPGCIPLVPFSIVLWNFLARGSGIWVTIIGSNIRIS